MPDSDMPTVLVVIPTFQEAENIGEVLARTRSCAPEASVLVVDDGSPDGTADLAEQMAAELGQIWVLRRTHKAGLGAAYRAGFTWGLERGFDVLVEMDADLSHDPIVLPDLIAPVATDEVDLCIGSRYVPGGSVPGWPAGRRRLSKAGNRYVGIMLRMPIRDSTAGFRAYRSSVLAQLGLDQVQADGYGFQIEMAYQVVRGGGRVREIPITFRDRVRGESKMSPDIVLEALRMVTRWGMRDRFDHLSRRARPTGARATP